MTLSDRDLYECDDDEEGITCPECDGTGKDIEGGDCDYCDGLGYLDL